MIPTKEEYEKAKKIVSAYENEQKRLLDIKLEEAKKELTEYFKNNKLDGFFEVKSFELRPSSFGVGYDILTEPTIEGIYGGDNNDDIEKIAEKYGVNIKFPYWMYPK
jgi:hypothetical protein